MAAALIGSSSSLGEQAAGDVSAETDLCAGADYVPYLSSDRFSNPPSLTWTVSEKVVLHPATHHPSSYSTLFAAPR